MENNVFRQLQDQNEVAFNQVEEDIKHNIENRKGVWTFIGGIIELYVPQVFKAFVGAGLRNPNHGLSSGDNS